jgi:hypothetical protein
LNIILALVIVTTLLNPKHVCIHKTRCTSLSNPFYTVVDASFDNIRPSNRTPCCRAVMHRVAIENRHNYRTSIINVLMRLRVRSSFECYWKHPIVELHWQKTSSNMVSNPINIGIPNYCCQVCFSTTVYRIYFSPLFYKIYVIETFVSQFSLLSLPIISCWEGKRQNH